MAQTEDPIQGIALAVGASIAFACADTTAKFLAASLPIIELAWVAELLFLALALLLVRRMPRRDIATARPWLQAARGLAVLGSSVLFVYGIRAMTMAQATTISFLSPLLVTVLAIPLLGETVGLRRWMAVFAGLLGMLIVVRPGSEAFHPAALFGVASSSCWAVGLILTRKLAACDTTQTTLLWSAAIGAGILSLLLPFDWAWPTPRQAGLLLLMGVLQAAGQSLVILAYRRAAASLLAPFSYTQLIWATAAGYLVFANLPDRWTLLGAAIIIVSGLFTAHRERVRARQGDGGPAGATKSLDGAGA